MKYPGGKNASGTYQRIINQIPPHRVYFEGCVGSGAILRMKRPAQRSIAVDCDPGAIAVLGGAGSGGAVPPGAVDCDPGAIAVLGGAGSGGAVPPGTELICDDVICWLGAALMADRITPDWFCYFDPPYLPETCASRCRYRFGMTRQEHEDLLELLKRLPCPAMLSGYASPLYAKVLKGWRTITFQQMTRGGYPAEETLWMNYPEPLALHDYRYLGENHDERWTFSKRRRRWVAKLKGMTVLQRRALLAALAECDQGAPPELAAAAAAAGSGGAVLGSSAAKNGRSGSRRSAPPALAASSGARQNGRAAGGAAGEGVDGHHGHKRRRRQPSSPAATPGRASSFGGGAQALDICQVPTDQPPPSLSSPLLH